MAQANHSSLQPEGRRSSRSLFLAFLAAGGGTILLADNLGDALGVVAPVFFGLAYYLMYRSSRLRRFSSITYAFFVFALVISVRHLVLDSSSVNGLLSSLNGLVLYQVIDTSVVFAPVILLVLANGGTLGSLFLQKGNLRLGLGTRSSFPYLPSCLVCHRTSTGAFVRDQRRGSSLRAFPSPIPLDRCSPQRAKGRTTLSRALPSTVRRLRSEAKHQPPFDDRFRSLSR